MDRDTAAYSSSEEYQGNRGADYGASYFQSAEGSGYTDYLTLARGPNRHLADTLANLFQPRSALDMGCAVGYVVKRLRELGVDAYGYDVSEWAVRKADAPYIQVLDLAKTEISRQFDLVLCYDVLEHIEESRLSFAIRNLWASAARYLVAVPALYQEGTVFDASNSNVRTFHDYTWWFDFITANCDCIFDREMSILLAQQEHSQIFNYSNRIFVFKRPLINGREHNSHRSPRYGNDPASDLDAVEKSAAGSAEPSSAREPAQARRTAETRAPDPGKSSFEAELRRDSGDIFRLGAAPVRSERQPAQGADAKNRANPKLLFDISDLIYYIGHHGNLSGIQRVQSSIIISILRNELYSHNDLVLLSFNSQTRRWAIIPTGFLLALLEDLFLPENARMVRYPTAEARRGLLPGAKEFDGTGVLGDGRPSVLCLLGAAWVHQDYLPRVLALKRRFGTRFVMTIHDLIPIYAKESCDQDTARVFEEFMSRILRHVDHILSVSEHTAADVTRYLQTLEVKEPPITITRNGSSFDEFLPKGAGASTFLASHMPERFVLFVATIEGRKNHQLMLKIWERMMAEETDPPHLICVGRLGWKSSAFISRLIETDYLKGRIVLLRDVSDMHLRALYEKCLFTVCPTFYEGWGLPVGESLAMGKICVCSNRASIPEVAGEYGVYIDIDNFESSSALIRELIVDDGKRNDLEQKIRSGYPRIQWKSVAETVIQACNSAAQLKWEPPYPYAPIPYTTEVAFARLDRNIDGTGELLLSRLMLQRRARYLDQPLDEQAFRLGEAIRSDGFWAHPEDWGTWACFPGGDIELALEPDPSRVFYVFLRLKVSEPFVDKVLRISIEGDLIWEGIIGSQGRDIVLRLRREVLASNSWRVRLSANIPEYSSNLRTHIPARDDRLPCIGFERLIVVPDSDITTRLDILYKLLL